MREQLQTLAALGHFQTCVLLGELVTFQHLDGDAVSIYAMPGDSSETYGEYQKMKAGDERGKFEVPIQDGFDGSVVHGDAITFDGNVYRVDSPIESDAIKAVFTLNVALKTARVI